LAHLTSRWYRDDVDLAAMLALVRSSIATSGAAAGTLHPGDVVWGLYQNETIVPAERVRLFEDDQGDLRGFAWLHPPREFSIHQDAARPLAIADLVAMIRWAEAQLGPDGPFGVDEVPAGDVAVALRAAGYRPTGEATFNVNTQALDGRLPAPRLPDGAAVRPVRADDPADVAARVALHREVWVPSKFSVEGYARLRQRPVYRADLDLVAVTPAGELAAYCIVWWDPETRVGEFEPVGAAVAHRRQGYAKALLLDALGRLRALGAETALVLSAADPGSEPARRLYASTGFALTYRFERWERAATEEGA
jgi:GNAT superfamily N-acetyltransferase